MKRSRKRIAESEANHRHQEGFTLVEVMITVVILGVILLIATMSYNNISRGMNLNGAGKQLEEAMIRAKTSARQENVEYRLVFYPASDSSHPNTYEFYHNEYAQNPSNPAEYIWTMAPVDKSVSGEIVTEVAGHWYIEVSNGVQIEGGTTTVTFNPTGTVMSITPATVNIKSVNKTAAVSIDSLGRISI